MTVRRTYAANNIRALRIAKGLTLDQLAKRMPKKTSHTTISKLERGERALSLDWINSIAKALGVKPHEIGGGADDRSGNHSNRLIASATAAAANSYAPYSKFKVGAAVLLTNGQVFTGANVENASYGLSLCAETVALAKVANEGRLAEVVEVAVIGLTSDAPVTPCGRCRQFLNEAAQLGGRDITVHCAAGTRDVSERHMLSTLLPHAFGPASL